MGVGWCADDYRVDIVRHQNLIDGANLAAIGVADSFGGGSHRVGYGHQLRIWHGRHGACVDLSDAACA